MIVFVKSVFTGFLSIYINKTFIGVITTRKRKYDIADEYLKKYKRMRERESEEK
jgi:uncharacterized membrane protein (DUF106 family)